MPVKPWPLACTRSGRAPAARVVVARVRLGRAAAVVERLQELAQRLAQARGVVGERAQLVHLVARLSLSAFLPVSRSSPSERNAGRERLARTARAREEASLSVGRGALQVRAAAGSARRSASPSAPSSGCSSSRKRGQLAGSRRRCAWRASAEIAAASAACATQRATLALVCSSCGDDRVGVGDEVLDDLVLAARGSRASCWSRAGPGAPGGAARSGPRGRPARPVPSSAMISRSRSR